LAANSAKVTGAVPVTSRTSLFGPAPLPLARVAVRGSQDLGVLRWRESAGAAPGWPSGLARDHGISRVTAYWYLDEVITVPAERAPDLAEAQNRRHDTRAALVLAHFEHSYIT
jgi:hypothetical protein